MKGKANAPIVSIVSAIFLFVLSGKFETLGTGHSNMQKGAEIPSGDSKPVMTAFALSKTNVKRQN